MLKKRILVIDDEEAIQEVIRGCLEELGEWEVLTASSGQEGLRIAELQLPDGILLDFSLPDIDGWEILQYLQQNSVTQTIPVALLTARVQLATQEQFSHLGVFGIILKPFDPLILADLVAEIFHWQV